MKMAGSETFKLFIGAFNLLSITRTQNGAVIADITYGEHPAGVISYTPTGYMAAVLTATDPELRPQELTLPAQSNQSVTDWAEVGEHTLAYSGPFHFSKINSFDSRKGEVIHGPLLTATLPRFVGSLQTRQFEFSEDNKFLTLIGNLGEGVVDTLVWQRLEHNDVFNQTSFS